MSGANPPVAVGRPAAQRLADVRRRFLAAHAIGTDPNEDALPAAISRAELREMLLDAIGVGFYAAPGHGGSDPRETTRSLTTVVPGAGA